MLGTVRSLEIALVGLLAGCVAEVSPGGTTPHGSSTSAGDDVCPADSPPLGCPYTGSFGACGENPSSELDEDCCRRPYCERHADCEAGMVCSYGGIASFGCELQQGGEGDGTCTCGADPSAQQRPMCMPPSSVQPDWCTQLRTQGECEGGEPIDLGGGDVRRCGWVAIEEVRFDTATRSCSRAEGPSRCITLTQPEGNGCSFDTCTFGEDPTEILGPLALPLDPSNYELLEAGGAQLCGVGTPVGAWLPADDASLGPCALTCG